MPVTGCCLSSHSLGPDERVNTEHAGPDGPDFGGCWP